MSIAELRGKLSPESAHDRMEDLLTSDAFGTMYYVGWHPGFQNWLLEAQRAGGSTVTIGDFLGHSPIQKVLFAFWPLLPNRREPDLALLVISEDGGFRLLIVEVKYLSGPSDFEVDTSAETATDLTGSQLVDQMVGFANIADCRSLLERWFKDRKEPVPPRVDFAHLFITTDRRLPHEIYEEASKHLGVAGLNSFPCPAFWLSWKSLARNLEPYIQSGDSVTSRLLTDLVRLLELKEITDKPFEGFCELSWPGKVPGEGFWLRPRLFDFAPPAQIVSVLGTDRTLCGFWKNLSLFSNPGYAKLAPPDLSSKSTHLFWRQRI